MSKHIFYNPNPKHNRTIDCTIRAICKATGFHWRFVQLIIGIMCFVDADMPSVNSVWGNFLRIYGFKRYFINKDEDYRYTLKDFCEDNPNGTYVVGLDGHVVCVVDGYYYDSWDSGDEEVVYFWER